MSKWFPTYDEALAFVCREGFPFSDWNATPSGWHYWKGQAACIRQGVGASAGLWLATTSF